MFWGTISPDPPAIKCDTTPNFLLPTTIYHFSTLGIVWSLFVDGPPTDEFLKNAQTFKDAVQSVCKHRLCLHFGIQNIEFYSTTIYIFMILENNKLSRHNNQALQEHKMK